MMKLIHLAAAGGLLMSLAVPAFAQMPPPHGDAGMHQNGPGPGHHGDMHDGPPMGDGHAMGGGAGMGGDAMRDHPGMNGGHRWHPKPRCRTVWHNHHRVRRCMR